MPHEPAFRGSVPALILLFIPSCFLAISLRYMEAEPLSALRRYHRIVILSVCGLPALGIIFLIRLFGTKDLILDEWGLTYFFQKVREGELLLNVVWSGNHEHRLVFPRLFFGLVAVLTRWDPRVVMYCSVVVLLIGWLAFLVSFIRYFGLNGRWSILIFFLCSLVLFGPSQQENWLWAFQFAFFLILACELVAIAILMNERVGLATRLVVVVSLCIVASFSSAHGLFSWAVLFPLLLAVSVRTRFGWLIVLGWLLLAIGVWAIYLHGLDLPGNGGLKSFLARPWSTVRFGLELVGNPFVGAAPSQTRAVLTRIVGGGNPCPRSISHSFACWQNRLGRDCTAFFFLADWSPSLVVAKSRPVRFGT
jgi:hypothetical protein